MLASFDIRMKKGIKLNDVLLYFYIELSMSRDLDIWKIIFGVFDSWIVIGSNENKHMELIICDAKVR
jgi:hypothetical protein